MPTNLYGPGDNYHLTNSHVLPALIRRFHEAVEAEVSSVTCWGTGTPLREFLHVDDLGEACVFTLERWQPGVDDPSLNVGTGVDLTIRELAETWLKLRDTEAHLRGMKKPDGTHKQLDVSRLPRRLAARIPLRKGLEDTFALYRQQLKLELVRLN